MQNSGIKFYSCFEKKYDLIIKMGSRFGTNVPFYAFMVYALNPVIVRHSVVILQWKSVGFGFL